MVYAWVMGRKVRCMELGVQPRGRALHTSRLGSNQWVSFGKIAWNHGFYCTKKKLMISLLPYDVIKYEVFLLIFPPILGSKRWSLSSQQTGSSMLDCAWPNVSHRLGCRLHTLDAPMKTKIAADHSWLTKSTAVSVSSWTKLTMYGTYFFLAEVVWSQQSGGWGNQGKCHPDRKSNWKWLEPAWARGQ